MVKDVEVSSWHLIDHCFLALRGVFEMLAGLAAMLVTEHRDHSLDEKSCQSIAKSLQQMKVKIAWFKVQQFFQLDYCFSIHL